MHAAIESIIKDWPRNPRESAKRLVDYYGEPDEYTPSQLVWFRTRDGWKRTVLSRTEVPHDFPAHHTDFLEQWIDARKEYARLYRAYQNGEKPAYAERFQFPLPEEDTPRS